MNIAAAVHCYQCARAAGNRGAAINHLQRIRAELRARRKSKPDQEKFLSYASTDRVQSIFEFAPPAQGL